MISPTKYFLNFCTLSAVVYALCLAPSYATDQQAQPSAPPAIAQPTIPATALNPAAQPPAVQPTMPAPTVVTEQPQLHLPTIATPSATPEEPMQFKPSLLPVSKPGEQVVPQVSPVVNPAPAQNPALPVLPPVSGQPNIAPTEPGKIQPTINPVVNPAAPGAAPVPPSANAGRPVVNPLPGQPGANPSILRPNPNPNSANNKDAPTPIARSLMFQYSDYDKINRVHQALIARKRSIVNNPDAKKGEDVLEGILSKLNQTDKENKPVEVKDIPSIYLSSIIYTGPNTGMAWINSKKYNMGDDKDGIKLITVDENSALIAWTVKNPQTDLSPISAILDNTDASSLDLTKNANSADVKKEKPKKKRDDIVAVDNKDRIVSIRLKPNQSFDTASFVVNEGKTTPSAPRPAPGAVGAAGKPPVNGMPQAQNGQLVMPNNQLRMPGTQPVPVNGNPQNPNIQNPLLPNQGLANSPAGVNPNMPINPNGQPNNANPSQLLPNTTPIMPNAANQQQVPNQQINPNIPNQVVPTAQPPQAIQPQNQQPQPQNNPVLQQLLPSMTTQQPVPTAQPANPNPPTVKPADAFDIRNLINDDPKPSIAPEKKIPDIQMQNAPAPASPNSPNRPSIFDKNNESFYNRDVKPNVPATDPQDPTKFNTAPAQ
jgi:hypothetical protein